MSSGGETVIASTPFGEVTTKRVTFQTKKGLLSGGRREDIPIRHITSVTVATYRRIKAALFLALVGIIVVAAAPGAAKVIGVLVILLAIFMVWGTPIVLLHATGGETRGAKGWQWMRGQAHEFTTALRNEMFKDERG